MSSDEFTMAPVRFHCILAAWEHLAHEAAVRDDAGNTVVYDCINIAMEKKRRDAIISDLVILRASALSSRLYEPNVRNLLRPPTRWCIQARKRLIARAFYHA